MKVVHVCLGIEHFIDTWGYQQNLLPAYHARLGLETVVVAAQNAVPSFVDRVTREKIREKGNDYYIDRVRIRRIPCYFPRHFHIQVAKALYWVLEEEKPEIIFFHGVFSFSIFSCVRYKRKFAGVRLVIDNHGDDLNINPNKIYRFLFLRLLWRGMHFLIRKDVDRYYGVTNARCRLLEECLKIDKEKIKLLPIGADTGQAEEVVATREELRKKYGFSRHDFMIVHGGKLDSRKGTANLVRAYLTLKDTYPQVKLVLFGKFMDEQVKRIAQETEGVVCYSWLSRCETFELFKLADVSVWPIHHTTLIEDAFAAGLPVLFRKTPTTEHLINEDTVYLNSGLVEELVNCLEKLISGKERDRFLAAVEKTLTKINYYTVARTVIQDCFGNCLVGSSKILDRV
ncbi:glycosyltransferase family 4 protein [Parabacteroides pacaensis]|uniref:glycosyltransferase family 4 protein n=1 Tax=Parabacteroides pacaensis TaxID=2086575 RepID=UPI000D0F2288|nr:glycosyltransferase family 4 protein [Parabacteroides pacaensis]